MKVGDKVLEKMKKVEPIRYGGVQTDGDEDSILRLPANFKVAPPLILEDIATEIQVGGVRARLDERERCREAEERERLEALRLSHQDPNLRLEDVRVSRNNTNWYNAEEKKVNHSHLRPNQMPRHKVMDLPGPMEDARMEMRLQAVLGELEERAKRYIGEHCDDKGNQEDNLTKTQRDGLNKVKKRLNEDVLVAMTDKSNNLNIDTKTNYKESMRPHVENDEKVTRKDHEKREHVLNAHGKQITRVLRIGEGRGDRNVRGCKDGMKTSDSKI